MSPSASAKIRNGVYISWLDFLIWDEEAVGSSPATPTNDGRFDKLVKSSPFQGGVTGSSPVPTTKMPPWVSG